MAQICSQCGAPIKEGHRFCSNCGASAAASPPQAASTPPVEPAEERIVSFDPSATPTLYGPQRPPPPPPPRDAAPPRAATMRPDAREGGMYVPYGEEAKTQLETPSSPRSRVIPAIIISAIVLAGLIGLTAFLLMGQKPVTSLANCNLPANPTEEDRVKQVVCVSNEEQIQAWRELDVEVLRGSRTGAVLEENIKYVENLKARNLYAVPVLGSLEVREVKITGDTATVSTVETWSVTFYNRQDNSVAEAQPAQTLAETYYMVKQNGKWLVERLDFGGTQ